MYLECTTTYIQFKTKKTKQRIAAIRPNRCASNSKVACLVLLMLIIDLTLLPLPPIQAPPLVSEFRITEIAKKGTKPYVCCSIIPLFYVMN